MIHLAATGHRPDKLGGYSRAVRVRLVEVARAFLREGRPQKVISGMALGWDQAVAHASIMEGIPFLAAVPFRGQERIWPLDAQRRYHSLLERAAEVDWGSEHPGTKALLDRNKWMMQRCDTVLALWNGSFHGGTAHAIAFATRKRLPIINLWSKFVGGNEWDDILG